MSTPAEAAIHDIFESAYMVGMGVNSAELKERADKAAENIDFAFAVLAELEKTVAPQTVEEVDVAALVGHLVGREWAAKFLTRARAATSQPVAAAEGALGGEEAIASYPCSPQRLTEDLARDGFVRCEQCPLVIHRPEAHQRKHLAREAAYQLTASGWMQSCSGWRCPMCSSQPAVATAEGEQEPKPLAESALLLLLPVEPGQSQMVEVGRRLDGTPFAYAVGTGVAVAEFDVTIVSAGEAETEDEREG